MCERLRGWNGRVMEGERESGRGGNRIAQEEIVRKSDVQARECMHASHSTHTHTNTTRTYREKAHTHLHPSQTPLVSVLGHPPSPNGRAPPAPPFTPGVCPSAPCVGRACSRPGRSRPSSTWGTGEGGVSSRISWDAAAAVW